MKHIFMKRCIILLSILLVVTSTYAQYSGLVTTAESDLIFEKSGVFDEVSLRSGMFVNEAGKPRLPIKELSYVIPVDAVVTGVSVLSVESKPLAGNYNIIPCMEDIPTNSAGREPGYTMVPVKEGLYPQILVELIHDEMTRGYHIVHLRFYPLRYDSGQQTLTLHTNIHFSIDYSISGTRTFKQPQQISQRRKQMVEKEILSIIENKADLERMGGGCKSVMKGNTDLNKPNVNKERELLKSTSLNIEDQLVPEYIIITTEELVPAFQVLADWKTQKGVPAIIKTVESITQSYPGTDIPEKIRNYLIAQYELYAGLFVLIGGDHQVVPARLVDGVSSSSVKQLKNLPSDLYYATVDGDWNPDGNGQWGDGYDYGYDHFVGRAPVSTIEEANHVINKFIGYEKLNGTNINPGYVENVLTAAAFMQKTGDGCSTLYYEFFNTIKGYARDYISDNCMSIALLDNHMCAWDSLNPYLTPYCYQYHSGLNCKGIRTYAPGGECTGGDLEFNKSNFMTALSGSVLGLNPHLLYHYDHAGERGIGTSGLMKNQSFRVGDLDGLSSNGHYKIILSVGCQTSIFTNDCIGENLLSHQNSDVVAFIGNADYGWTSEHYYFSNFCKSLYSTTASVTQNNNLGVCFQKQTTFSKNRQRLILFGDPEASVWTQTPTELNVAVSPSHVVNGDNTIVVELRNLQDGEEATICLWKRTEGYAVQQVSANGSYAFYFSPDQAGDVSITVTADNHLPFETMVPVQLSQNRNLYLESVRLVDDNSQGTRGNGDAKVAAGEILAVYPTVKNNGLLPADQVQVELLSSNDAIVEVDTTNLVVELGTVDSQASQETATPFLICVSPEATEVLNNAPSDKQVKLLVKITVANGISFFDEVNLEILAPELEQRNKIIVNTTDGDPVIEVGELVDFSVELFNSGSSHTGNLSAELSSSSALVANIVRSQITYADMAPVSFSSGSNTFQINVANMYQPDVPMLFSLMITNEYGRSWQFQFDLNNRPAKFDIGSITAHPSASTITLIGNTVYNASDRYNFYRCAVDDSGNLAGDFQQVNSFLNEHTLFEDVGLQKLTPYAYKFSVVNTEGTEGELSDYIIVYTSYPSKNGFPVEMSSDGDILCSPVCADVDGDFMKEIFLPYRFEGANEGVIIGINHDGTEMFDIDGNITTKSGMANINAVVWAGLAVGDLNDDNQQEVVVATRGGVDNCLAAFSTKDENGGYEPNRIFKLPVSQNYVRPPVLCNVDNSADGSLESIFGTESSGIKIVDNAGGLLTTIGGGYGWDIGSIAVSDLDGDGDFEIIRGHKQGVFIWHHDGSDFGQNPMIQIPGLTFRSSVVVCDMEGDGEKDIVCMGIVNPQSGTDEGAIYIFDKNGVVKNGWNGLGSFLVQEEWHTPGISVADFNTDGKLEVITSGKERLVVFNSDGSIGMDVSIPNYYPYKHTPLVGDVDDDNDLEIVCTNSENGNVYGYNLDGSCVKGFPLKMAGGSGGSPCLTDLDNNGKTDIIATSQGKIYVWETNGDAARIAWGSSRFNNWNTGSIDDCFLPPHKPVVNSDGKFVFIQEVSDNTNIVGYVYSDGQVDPLASINMQGGHGYSVSDLPIPHGEKVTLRVVSANDFDDAQLDMSLYHSACGEKTVFTSAVDLFQDIDVQKFESPDTIALGGNVVIPVSSSVIMSAKDKVTLSEGFKVPHGGHFYAYIEGCQMLLKGGNQQVERGLEIGQAMESGDMNFVVYPNPSRGIFNIRKSECDDCSYSVSIYNIAGTILLKDQVSSIEYVLDISKYGQGTYLLVLKNDMYKKHFKLIVN